MAILSQYKKDGKFNRLAQTYKSRMEKYYEEYIYAVVKDRDNGMFAQFSAIFPDKNFTPRIELLDNVLHELGYNQLHFRSIIDSDIYMFGLVYYTVIQGYHIDLERKGNLLNELQREINDLKQETSHTSSPSLLKHMRNRVEQSIRIFGRYVIHPAQ